MQYLSKVAHGAGQIGEKRTPSLFGNSFTIEDGTVD